MSGPYHGQESATWFVMDGSVTVGDRQVGAGEWLFMAPRAVQRQFHGVVEFLSIGLRWRWPEGRHLYDPGLPLVVEGYRLQRLKPICDQVVRDVTSLVGEQGRWLPSLQAGISIHARLHELGAQWAVAYAAAMEELGVVPDPGLTLDPRLEPVRLLLTAWPLDRAFDAEAIQRSSPLSSRQLQRLFQQETGKGPREYFETRRYEHVRNRLLLPALRIKEVAASVGFSDLAAFNRWFQRRSGQPPRAFRRAFLG